MSSPTSAEPSAKRVKVSTETPTEPFTTSDTKVVSTSSAPFSFANETGLFKLIEPSLGIRASTEPEVGITEYADPDVPPFSAIIKHRFTDFMVFEVGMDGEVVRLKDIKGPKKEKQQRPKDQAQSHDGGTSQSQPPLAKLEPQELWNENAESIMSPLLSETKRAELKQFVLDGPPTTRDGPKPVFRSETIDSKDARTAFHKGLREAFNSRLQSEMKELEGGSQIIEVMWKAGGGGGGGRGGAAGGSGGRQDRVSRADKDEARARLPPYIHFTLQKTNKEMHDAVSGLCRSLNVQSRDIGAAGTKDKRAVTVQRLSMKRGNRTIEDVWTAANGGGRGGGNRGRGRGRGGFGGSSGWGNLDRGVRIGDVEYGDRMFTLGMLKGNRFVITLRDVNADSLATIERAMETLRTRGFINYYGMQRFGTAPVPTHAVGLALLRTDWALASHLILLPREGEGEDVAIARQVFHEGKHADALRIMPRRAVAERAMVEFYSRNGTTDHLGALSAIPKNLRMMYVHAWQSYIWNRVVSERVRLYGCTEPIVGDLVYAEGADPKEDGEGTERGETEGVAVEPLDPSLDDDAEPSVSAAGPMTAERAALMSRVPKVKTLTQADIDAKTYSIFDVILPMPGFAVVYPSGPLGETYRSIMLQDRVDPDDMFRKQKEYSLGGAYRKIMHLPKDVKHRLMAYTSSTQDLAQSDEDVLLGREPPAVTPYDSSMPLPEGHSLALQLEITLGSSTYATMALREVLKVRTASAHQKALTEAMEERLNKPVEAVPVAEQEAPTAEASME